MKNDRIRLTLFQGLVRTIADTKMIQVLTSMITDNAIQEKGRVARLSRLSYRGVEPKFSFVRTIRHPIILLTKNFPPKVTKKGLKECQKNFRLILVIKI